MDVILFVKELFSVLAPWEIIILALLCATAMQVIKAIAVEAVSWIGSRRSSRAFRILAERYGPTHADIVAMITHRCPLVKRVAITEIPASQQIIIDIRVSWLAILMFGLYHRFIRERLGILLREVVPAGVAWTVRDVQVGRLEG